MALATQPRREYGSGSITWLSPSARPSQGPGAWPERGQRSKVVLGVSPKDKGGIREAGAELEKFAAELAAGHRARTADRHGGLKCSQAYLVHCKRIGRTQSTIESYEHAVTRVPTTLGSLPLAQLSARHLDALFGDLADRLADNTIRQTHAILTAALEQAVKWGWIADNPAKGATAPGRHKPKRSALPLPEVARLVAAASAPRKDGSDGDVVLAMAIAVAALTGARRGELCGMQWNDIDPVTCSITIERQWVPGEVASTSLPRCPKMECGRWCLASSDWA